MLFRVSLQANGRNLAHMANDPNHMHRDLHEDGTREVPNKRVQKRKNVRQKLCCHFRWYKWLAHHHTNLLFHAFKIGLNPKHFATMPNKRVQKTCWMWMTKESVDPHEFVQCPCVFDGLHRILKPNDLECLISTAGCHCSTPRSLQSCHIIWLQPLCCGKHEMCCLVMLRTTTHAFCMRAS